MKKIIVILTLAITCFSFSGISNSKSLLHLNNESECFSTVWERESMWATRMLNITGSGGIVINYTIVNVPAAGAYCYEINWVGVLPPED